MLLTISTTHRPATDLSFLLHKHPDRFQSFETSYGHAHVFYPLASPERCTACLMVEVDPVGLVRRKQRDANFALAQYVNDRPYVASSLMSVAISQVFGSALQGRSKEREQLTTQAIPLEATLQALPVRGGDNLLREVFEPLGYTVDVQRHALDDQFSDWGDSVYYTVTLSKTTTLAELLAHLYVLIPVFDNHKHYYVGHDELDKLLRKSRTWLSAHPLKEQIARRYLKFQSGLYREALARLAPDELPAAEDETVAPTNQPEQVLERPLSLNEQRLGAVCAALRSVGARRIVDLGCGEGKLLRELLRDRQFEEIVGLDVSLRSLEVATERLRLERLPAAQAQRIRLLHGSLMYRDKRLSGYDAAAVVEVVEHLDPPRLSAFERVLFEFARPTAIVLTTPNREYNALWESLPAGRFRHSDHRFEWTRGEFQEWAEGLAGQFGYRVRLVPIGPIDAALGSPTQMAIFQRDP